MDDLEPTDLMRALNDVPLIRELQRMVTSNPGPINWEIAQQIARAVAGAGKLTHAPTRGDIDDFTDDCRIAELQIAARTGSDPSHSIAETSVLDRKAWADLNLDILRPLLEKLALHLGQQLTAAPIPQFQSALGALTPFFFGIQVGFLIGYLSRRVQGQSELMLPSSEHAPLRFVLPNIAQAQTDLELDPQQFRLWLAMKEVAHKLRYQDVAWGAPYLDSLVSSYIEGGTIDPNELRNRIQSLGDAEEISRVMERPEELIPLLATPEQEQTLSQIQVFLSLIEGHVEWTLDLIGPDLLPQYERIREAVNRRRVERSSAEKLLVRLLGLDLRNEHYRAGIGFIRTVSSAQKLDLLWADPTSLPTLEEVGEPSRWLARVAFS